MRKFAGIVFLLFLAGVGSAGAGQQATLELSDGSVIHGEILSMDGSVYRVKTSVLDTVTIDSSKIKSISFGNPAPGAGARVENSGRPTAVNRAGEPQGAVSPNRNASETSAPVDTAKAGEPDPISSLVKDQVKAIQKSMLSNEGMLDTLATLSEDPDVKAVLNDPEVMKAVQSGDIASLRQNPKIIGLLNKSSVQDVIKKVK